MLSSLGVESRLGDDIDVRLEDVDQDTQLICRAHSFAHEGIFLSFFFSLPPVFFPRYPFLLPTPYHSILLRICFMPKPPDSFLPSGACCCPLSRCCARPPTRPVPVNDVIWKDLMTCLVPPFLFPFCSLHFNRTSLLEL